MALHTYTPTEWKNAPDHKTTPVNASNLNHIEQGIANAYSDIADVDGKVDAASDIYDFTISTTWAANADTGDYSTYPYKQTISTARFTHANEVGYKAPDWETLAGNPSDFMSAAEREDDAKLCAEANFTTSGITVLATEATTNALTMRVRGLGQWQ